MDNLETINDIFVVAAQSISQAVENHGADAVELGLVVYQISATQGLLSGFLGLVGVIVVWVLCYKNWPKLEEYEGKRGKESREVDIILLLCLAAIPSLFSLSFILNLFDVYSWAAVLGYPEVLIAYKALSAAGLM